MRIRWMDEQPENLKPPVIAVPGAGTWKVILQNHWLCILQSNIKLTAILDFKQNLILLNGIKKAKETEVGIKQATLIYLKKKKRRMLKWTKEMRKSGEVK